MTTEIQKHDSGKMTVRTLVESPAYTTRIKQLLGERAPQFCSSLIQLSQDYKLAKCDPNSIIAAAMTAATLDLPINPNLGFAHIIPYGTQAQFQLGYKAYIQLATRSGQYKRLNVTEVYEGELLKYDRVKGDVILDEAKRTGDKVVGYVAYFELVNGAEHAEYWSVQTVIAHASRFSQAYRAKKMDSPWFTSPDAMGKKTVIKSLISHWGPMSVQMQNAVIEDQGIRSGIDSELEYPDSRGAVQEESPKMGLTKIKRASKKSTEPAGENISQPAGLGAGPSSGTENTEQAVVRQLLNAGVTYDDFTDYIVNQGIMRNAKDYPGYDDLPPSVYDALAAGEGALLQKVIKLYGKPNA